MSRINFKATLLSISCVVACLSSIIASDDLKLNEIIRQREKLLTQILDHWQAQYDSRHGSTQQVRQAKLTLARFKRDSAKDNEHKTRHQEDVIALLQEQVDGLDVAVQNGVKQSISLMQAGRGAAIGCATKTTRVESSEKP